MRAPMSIARLLLCWSLAHVAVMAQPAGGAGLSSSSATAGAPAPPPVPKSRVAYFRDLLAMGPVELSKALRGLPENQRNALQAKLREYAALTPTEREARLRATELRWYLRPLMNAPSDRRADQVASVPVEYRTLVEDRLRQWDALPHETQKEVLENEWTLPYFLRLQSASLSEREDALRDFSPGQRQKLERQLAFWQALPLEHRQRMGEYFRQFFELSAKEKEKTLNTLSDAERQEMEKTLQAFESLPPAQRRACINSFQKFASMSPPERAQFLKNAGRWKEMSAGERQTWRMLVAKLPPLPPGFGEPPIPQVPKRKPGAPSPGAVSLTNAAP